MSNNLRLSLTSNNVNVNSQNKLNQEDIVIEHLQEKIKLLQDENAYLREQNKILMEQQNQVLLEILKERYNDFKYWI